MKDTGNPTRWQVAGLALAAGVIATGLALSPPAPRLDPGGEPGGIVRTIAESPERRARLVDMVRRAETADDEEMQEQPEGGDGTDLEQDGTTGPSGDQPAPSEPAPSPEDAAEEDVSVEEDPPARDHDGNDGDLEGRAEHDIVDDEERDGD